MYTINLQSASDFEVYLHTNPEELYSIHMCIPKLAVFV